MSEAMTPEDVITFINELFTVFDLIVDKHGVHKVGIRLACMQAHGHMRGLSWQQRSAGAHSLACLGQSDQLSLPVRSCRHPQLSSAHAYTNISVVLCALQIDMLGDAFVVAAGVLVPDADGFNVVDTDSTPEDNARRVFECAKDLVRAANKVIV